MFSLSPSLPLFLSTLSSLSLSPSLPRRFLFQADNRDQIRGAAELLKLATWGPKHLSDALDEADREMVTDKVNDAQRLKSTRFLAVMLQADPAKRPQTMAEALAHPFFPKDEDEDEEENEDEEGVVETKGDEEAEDTVPPPSSHHFAPLHLAAAMGDLPAVESTVADTSAADRSATSKRLNEREPLLGRRPLHFAVDFVHPNVVRVLIDAGADVKAEDDAGATPLDRVPAARQRYKGDAEKEAALQKLSQMLTMAVLALSIPFVKSLPLHLGIEVVAQVLAKAYKLAITGTGENTACIGFTIVICDAQVLLRKDEDGDGVYGEVSQDAFDFTAFMAKAKPIWTTEGFKQLQAAATQVNFQPNHPVPNPDFCPSPPSRSLTLTLT